jgi:poly(beta-D-mannuronate) lyase
MKNLTLLNLFFVLVMSSCNSGIDGVLVKDANAFDAAVKNAISGDKIILANGIWKNTELVFTGKGEKDKPITLTVQEKGKVFLEGQSNLKIGGEYLHVEGLVFRNGYTPTGSVISYRKDKNTPCNNCRVTECVIDDYNPSERFDSDYWVDIYGKNNRFDHNYMVGKRNRGVTLAVRLTKEEDRQNNHRIDHNYFGYHPILGSNGGETLRIGTSHHSLTNSNTLVEDNYFERCNGEHEIISNKSCQNTFRNNTFYECQGTLTMRHGNETLVDNNYFFGNRKPNTGGIRIINEKQTVINNYCEGLTGYRFRGALVIMNGVPNSPINRYFQVQDSKASNNLIIDCDYIQLCAGSDEERSAVPIDSEMSNNIIYNEKKDDVFTVYDDISGIAFNHNILSENIIPPVNKNAAVGGFLGKKLNFQDINEIKRSIDFPDIGPDQSKDRPDANNTGVSWYPKKNYEIVFNTGKLIEVAPGINTLFEAVHNSSKGDILQLSKGNYHLTKSIDINHTLSIKSVDTSKPTLTFERSSLFNIENGGSLSLEGLQVNGSECDDYAGNSVIRTSRYSMIDNYKLMIRNCDFTDLDVNHSFNVLKVYKNTFADSILLADCTFDNISGHVLNLDKEIDDIGIYNAEDVEIVNCTFKDIGGSALKLHRGGRDESTFGPILKMHDSEFDNVGYDQRNKNEAAVLLHGVQLAEMNNLNFKNSRKLQLHLIVGEPVIKIKNTTFINSEGIKSNDNAYQTENIKYQNQESR